MFLEPRARWKTLSQWCRSLGTLLRSGVRLPKALKILSGQTSDGRLRQVTKSIVEELHQGEDIATALKHQGKYFPELVTDMVQVAEKTGALPEVLGSLAEHYENLMRLRRLFLSQIAWPVFQLVVAILVVAGLILILGWIGESSGRQPMDVLGLGLFGVKGALTWLGYCMGTGVLLWVGYMFVVRGLRQQALVHGLLLKIPVVGDCLRSFAVARFAWAYALTQQAGMEIKESLESSFKATSNGAFLKRGALVTAMVMDGEDLTDSLQATGLFPGDVIEMIRVGEASGTVPETLEQLGPEFEERARRSLSLLTVVLGWMVWLFVAGMITFFIFRIALFYVGLINAAASGNFEGLD